jgi:hypothetical protein
MPVIEYILDGRDNRSQGRKIPIMSSHTASQLPNPFDGVEFGAVRWHEFQGQTLSTFFPPVEMQLGMMIFDVVEDQDNMAPSMTTDSSHLLEKGEKRLPIEAFFFLAVYELAVPDTHSAKVADPFVGGMMQKNRIGDFRRNPHPAGRTMLFKTDLVYSPHVESIVMRQIMDFFYMMPAVPDRHAPFSDEAYETGTPDPETGAGIAEHQAKPPSFVG